MPSPKMLLFKHFSQQFEMAFGNKDRGYCKFIGSVRNMRCAVRPKRDTPIDLLSQASRRR